MRDALPDIRSVEHLDPGILLRVMKRMYPGLQFNAQDIISKRNRYGDNLRQWGAFVDDHLIAYANIFFVPAAQSATIALFYEQTSLGNTVAQYLADHVLSKGILEEKGRIRLVAAYAEESIFFYQYLLSRGFQVVQVSIDWQYVTTQQEVNQLPRRTRQSGGFQTCVERTERLSAVDKVLAPFTAINNDPALGEGLFNLYYLQHGDSLRIAFPSPKEFIEALFRQPKLNLHASTMVVDKNTGDVVGSGLVINTADGPKIKKILLKQGVANGNLGETCASLARMLLLRIFKVTRPLTYPLWLNTKSTDGHYYCLESAAKKCGFVPMYRWATLHATLQDWHSAATN